MNSFSNVDSGCFSNIRILSREEWLAWCHDFALREQAKYPVKKTESDICDEIEQNSD